jgi:hypothetical protein
MTTTTTMMMMMTMKMKRSSQFLNKINKIERDEEISLISIHLMDISF